VRIVGANPTAIELEEWESVQAPEGIELTERDRGLVASLKGGEGRLHVDELVGSIRLRATSWIGVVRFEQFEVRVVPKLVGGNLGVLEMLEYASGLSALRRLRASRELHVVPAGRLIDLLAELLAEAAEQILRDGLLQDYVTRDETLGVLRGRLRIHDQVRRRFARIDQLECRFDELETNVPDNQLLSLALGLARRVCRNPDTRRRVARLHGLFCEAADPSAFNPGAFPSGIEYNRRNDRYRTAHAVGWLFIRRLAVHDLFARGGGRSYAFLLDMNALFEQFVTRLLETTFAGSAVRVVAQRRDDSLLINERTTRSYASVIPDVLLERPDADGRRRVPLDAKYKLYDERRLEMSDIYQTFFYGYAYARREEHETGNALAFLVYPATTSAPPVRLRVRRADHVTTARIRTIALDVPAALREVREGREPQLAEMAEIRAAIAAPTDGRMTPGSSEADVGGPTFS
jgi:5-methylcytosine-specific restriction enzyme subunit McrC